MSFSTTALKSSDLPHLIKTQHPAEKGGHVADMRDVMNGDMKVGPDHTDSVKGGLESKYPHIDTKDRAPAQKTTVTTRDCIVAVEDRTAVADSEEDYTRIKIVSSVVHPGDDTYEVEVERINDNPIGLECAVVNSDELCVMNIGVGLFLDWNMMHHKSFQIWEGDRIVEANNITNNSIAMLAAISNDSRLKIKFRQRKEFEVWIAKGDEPLGIGVSCKKSCEGLRVNKVSEGLVSAWNAANPTRQILENDRIVEVNGLRGEPKRLLDTVKSASDLTMTVVSFN
eukprot:TRINITY_DN1717_c0_g1_i1.p1 TRINITY_DN1717_c0_g1~~TRINITY_DN1717_c0_g1_i1.p1  ORF type:complete len:283 (-),score=46.03 TRINITY_DN1717_c0_g1_i1:298-1146(-)